MLILLSAALAAAAPAAQSTPPAHQHGAPQSKMAGHEQMKDCCKCCEEMMAKMHADQGPEHKDHQPN